MLRVLMVVAVVIGSSPSLPAQPKDRPARSVLIQTPNGWLLFIHSDGSGLLQYGSNGDDGWRFKAGTIDVARAEKDLRALASDAKGGSGSHFVFHFESERKAPDESGPARYTRDEKVIPGLLKAAADATAGRGEFNAARRAELLKNYPLGKLPKKK
jgi:hypothetical protein